MGRAVSGIAGSGISVGVLGGGRPMRSRRARSIAVIGAGVVAYAVSPIDLIPDFVPVLGYLDDLVIVPLGIALAVHLVPPGLMAEYRCQAAERAGRPRSLAAAVVIGLVWAASLGAAALWLYRTSS